MCTVRGGLAPYIIGGIDESKPTVTASTTSTTPSPPTPVPIETTIPSPTPSPNPSSTQSTPSIPIKPTITKRSNYALPFFANKNYGEEVDNDELNLCMRNSIQIFSVILMTIIVMFVIYKIINYFYYRGLINTVFGNNHYGSHFDNNEEDALTKCGWEVYVTDHCPYCKQQKQILSEHYPKFKNFKKEPVNVVPTWKNVKTGQTLPGMQSVDSLANMAKC
jgi:hypothetical protein